MARPKSDNPRVHSIGFKLTKDEFEKLKGLARARHITLGEFSRTKALSGKLPPPPVNPLNKEAWIALSKTASNLNQLTRQLNSRDQVKYTELTDTIDQLSKEVKHLRLNLMGSVKDDT